MSRAPGCNSNPQTTPMPCQTLWAAPYPIGLLSARSKAKKFMIRTIRPQVSTVSTLVYFLFDVFAAVWEQHLDSLATTALCFIADVGGSGVVTSRIAYEGTLAFA